MADGKEIVGICKDSLASLKELIILAALLLFLFLPSVMNGILTRAGFTSADIAGFKWELQQSVQQTQAASDTVAQLEESFPVLNRLLQEVSLSTATPPEVKRQITSLAAELGKAKEQTTVAQKTLQSSLRVQRSIIQGVEPKLLEQMVRPPAPQR
jgi:septal ring factor EnvC (AmiA/AmiB activator)